VSNFIVQGGCDHMPTVPPDPKGCAPRFSAEVSFSNGGSAPVEVTLERAFLSTTGGIGAAVDDVAITCDRGNGTPVALEGGAKNHAIIALPQIRGRGHGERLDVTLLFRVGSETLLLRASGPIHISQ
jgi:hypothetical protein